jgi:glycogen debranching enzyme
LELDDAVIEFSSTLASKGLPTLVTSERDINTLMKAFSEHIKKLDFWQFYVLDVTLEKASVKSALLGKVSPWKGPPVAGKSVVELAQLLRSLDKVAGLGKFSARFGVHVDPVVAAGLVKAEFVNINGADALAEAWVRVVEVLNVPLYEEWEADTKIALDQIKGRLGYLRLEEGGPKMGEISKSFVISTKLISSSY